MFVEEFFGILRNTLGIPIFVPWFQGVQYAILDPTDQKTKGLVYPILK